MLLRTYHIKEIHSFNEDSIFVMVKVELAYGEKVHPYLMTFRLPAGLPGEEMHEMLKALIQRRLDKPAIPEFEDDKKIEF